jgi:hypothetical protein
MYSEDQITRAANRIGFGIPTEEGFAPTLSEANSAGESNRIFKSFHSLVTVENIFHCNEVILANESGSSNALNDILDRFRLDAAREVLPLVLDRNLQYITTESYDKAIEDNIVLFDDCLGYKVAIMVLEMFMSTNRVNIQERNAKLTKANLMLEINGYRNENGGLIARGLVQEFNSAVKAATLKIFPVAPPINGGLW